MHNFVNTVIFVIALTLIGTACELTGMPWMFLVVLPILIWMFLPISLDKEEWFYCVLDLPDVKEIIRCVSWKYGEDQQEMEYQLKKTAVRYLTVTQMKIAYWTMRFMGCRPLNAWTYNVRYDWIKNAILLIRVSFLIKKASEKTQLEIESLRDLGIN